MANNRMYITCGVCGGVKLLCKYYPSTFWYIFTLDNENTEDRFNEWLDKHKHFEEDLPHDEMWGPTHFTLTYEVST